MVEAGGWNEICFCNIFYQCALFLLRIVDETSHTKDLDTFCGVLSMHSCTLVKAEEGGGRKQRDGEKLQLFYAKQKLEAQEGISRASILLWKEKQGIQGSKAQEGIWMRRILEARSLMHWWCYCLWFKACSITPVGRTGRIGCLACFVLNDLEEVWGHDWKLLPDWLGKLFLVRPMIGLSVGRFTRVFIWFPHCSMPGTSCFTETSNQGTWG